MDDEHIEIPVHVTGDIEPAFVKAFNIATDMAAEAGWTVERVIVHKLTPEGLSMWRLGGSTEEE